MARHTLDEIRERLHRAETELAEELESLIEHNRERFRYTISAGRVRFEAGMHALHRSQRTGLLSYIRSAPLSFVLSAPVTYSLILPMLLTDLWVTVFQQICFRVYGIPQVRRSDYVVIDRQALGYLNGVEKLNCVYCGYANGLFGYCREVAARMEQFWCPIKHARKTRDPHRHEAQFFDFGDAAAYRADLPRIRAKLLD